MDQCMNAALGSLSIGALLIVSEALPFIRRVDANSLVEVVMSLVSMARRAYGIYRSSSTLTLSRFSSSVSTMCFDDPRLLCASDPTMYEQPPHVTILVDDSTPTSG